MKKFILFNILLFNAFVLIAQNNCKLEIKGQIKSEETKEYIPGAVVYLKGTNYNAISDENGFYQIKNICPGHYILVTEISSFTKNEIEIHLEHNEVDNIVLKENIVQLNNVTISTQRSESSPQLSEKVDLLTRRERVGENLGTILRGLTGVESLQTGSTISKPVIHGMHSNRVIILNQGIRQEGQSWGSEHAPEIDPFVSKNIQVIKGPAGLRYGGDAIGGIILMEPNPLPDSSQITGELQSVYFTNGRQWVGSSYLQGGIEEIKGFGWRIQGTLKNGGNTFTPNYNLANTGISEKNFSVALGLNRKKLKQDLFFSYFNTEIGIYAGSHIGNIVDLTKAIQRTRPFKIYTPDKFIRGIQFPKQEVNHNLLKYKTSYQLPNKSAIRLTLSHQFDHRKEYDIPRNNKVSNLYYFKLNTYSSELIYDEINKPKSLRGLFGMNLLFQENMTSGLSVRRPTITSSLLPNYHAQSLGVFGIEKLTKEKYEIEVGGRMDYREMEIYMSNGAYTNNISEIEKKYIGLSGSIGGKYHWSHKFEQNLTIARAFRPPSVNELYSNGVHHGAGAFEIGNSNLRGEKSLNFSLNNVFSLKNLEGEIGIYTNLIQDFVYLLPVVNQGEPYYTITVRGAFPTFKYTQINAQFSGIDANFNYTVVEHLRFSQKYSLIQARNINSSTYLVNIPTNRATWELNYQFDNERQIIGLGWTQVAKQNRYTSGTDFLAPPKGYGLMEFNWDLTYNKIDFGIRITNLFNTEYRDYLNRFRYYTADIGRNISIRVNYKI